MSAEYYAIATIDANIPLYGFMFYERELAILDECFGITYAAYKGGEIVLTAEEHFRDLDDFFEGDKRYKFEVTKVFQEILRRHFGYLDYINIEVCYCNDRFISDNIGGAAYFITADSVEWVGTNTWLYDQIKRFEKEEEEDHANLGSNQ